MAFFRPHVYSAPYTQQPQPDAEPSFHSLFRLLEDWDNHRNASTTATAANHSNSVGNAETASHPRKRQHLLSRSQQQQPAEPEPVFMPRFDVKETESAYELYGDLPGISKEAINIEFSDPQTLVVSGRVERPSFSPSPKKKNSTGTITTGIEDEDAVMISHHENEHGDEHSETCSQRSFQATVEDDVEESSSPAGTAAAKGNKNSSSDKTMATTTNNVTANSKTAPQPQQAPQEPKHKYWISERPYGNFTRTFAFPERLDIDNVAAGLENGVLALVVPKARKYEAKRIRVL